MKAEHVIKLLQSLEPVEIEKFFILIKEYEAEVRCRQASTRYIPMDQEFEKTVNQIFAENNELFQKLAEYEAKEREAQVK